MKTRRGGNGARGTVPVERHTPSQLSAPRLLPLGFCGLVELVPLAAEVEPSHDLRGFVPQIVDAATVDHRDDVLGAEAARAAVVEVSGDERVAHVEGTVELFPVGVLRLYCLNELFRVYHRNPPRVAGCSASSSNLRCRLAESSTNELGISKFL